MAERLDIELKLIDKASGGLKSVQGQISKTTKGFTLMKAAVVAASAALSAGFIRNNIAAADAIGKVADKTGFASDALQELRFAADQAGISSQTLDTALQRFSRRVGEAAQGTGVLKDILIANNIAIRNNDGTLRNIQAVFNDYNRAIANAGSEQEKLRLAVAAFDMEGANMVNMLSDGTAGLDEMRQAAKQLGIVMDRETIDKATEAEDAMAKLRVQFKGIATIATAELAPALTEISEKLSKMLQNPEVMDRLAAGMSELGNALVYVVDNFDKLILALKGFALAWVSAGVVSATGAMKVFGSAIGNVVAKLFGSGGLIAALRLIPTLAKPLAILGGIWSAVALAIWGAWEAISAYFDSASEGTKQAIEENEKLAKSYEDVGLAALQAERTKLAAKLAAARTQLAPGNEDPLGVGASGVPQFENAVKSLEAELSKLDAKIAEYKTHLTGVGKIQRDVTKAQEENKPITIEITRNKELLNFQTEREVKLQKDLQKIYDEMAKMTLPELEKRYYDIAAEARDAASEAIRLENERRAGLQLAKLSLTEEQKYYEAAFKHIKQLQEETKKHYDQSRKWSTGWKQAFNEYVENATNAADQARDAFTNAAQAMEDAIVSFAKTGKFEFGSFVQSMIDDLLRVQAKKLIGNAFGFLNSGSFAGFFANGGTIPAGQFGIAGEAGPELISGPATVTPLGGATSVTYNINAVDAASFKQMVARDPQFLFAVTEEGRRGLPSRA